MNKPELLRQIATAMEQDPDGWWANFLTSRGNACLGEYHLICNLLEGGLRPRRRTIRINVEVPEPMREIPQDGAEFWTIDQTEQNGVCSYAWLGVIEDRMVFERGIWATEAEAKQAADAIFGALADYAQQLRNGGE